MHLTRGEKQLLIAACVAASVLGIFGGYLAFAEGEEHQFHGGVLEEDAAAAMWQLIRAAIVAFAEVGSIAVLTIGVIPLWIRRCFFGIRG